VPAKPIFDVTRCQRRKNGDRLEAVQEVRDRLLVDVEPVRHERERDARRLGLLRGAHEEAQVHAGIGRPARVLP
jgi:hypothetical protein